MRERYLPPGRTEGSTQPIVEVTYAAQRALGNPEVNYPLLNTLMRKDFAIPERITPRVVLFGEAGWGNPSFHVPLTPTVHINAARCAFNNQQTGNERLTQTLLQLSQQLSRSANYPHLAVLPYAVSPGLIALEELAFRFAAGHITEKLDTKVKLAIAVITSGLGIAVRQVHRWQRARDIYSSDLDNPLMKKYKETIVFPKPRAA